MLHPEHQAELRRKAEEQLAAATAAFDGTSAEDMQTVLHDLHVHQIELTLQNEDLRRAQTELAASRSQYIELYRQYANLYEFAPVGYYTLNEAGSIRNMNLTAALQLGLKRAALLNTRLYQHVCEDDRDTLFAHLRAAFDDGSRRTCELRLQKSDGALFWAHVESIAVSGARFDAPDADASAAKRCLTTVTDISERKHAEALLKRALEEKNVLMKELLHRTKNNMSAIISLLRLVSMRHQENAPLLDIFRDIEQRIHAMLLVQQQLYRSEEFAQIDLKTYLSELAPSVFHNLRGSAVKLSLRAEAARVSPDRAIVCGMLANELLTNALKHAFPPSVPRPPDPDAEIRVALQRLDADAVELLVSDNGVGLPEDLDLSRPESLGLSLVAGFAGQLGGTLEVERAHGTCWRIRFPLPSPPSDLA